MRLPIPTLAGVAMSALLATQAGSAQAAERDQVYADNYGNLVIESVTGYKRILVGEGHQAQRLAAYVSAGEPKVVYADGEDRDVASRDCWRPPVLVKGRSYMYGFDEGEIPLQGGPCR
jgi:hypothetical protein